MAAPCGAPPFIEPSVDEGCRAIFGSCTTTRYGLYQMHERPRQRTCGTPTLNSPSMTAPLPLTYLCWHPGPYHPCERILDARAARRPANGAPALPVAVPVGPGVRPHSRFARPLILFIRDSLREIRCRLFPKWRRRRARGGPLALVGRAAGVDERPDPILPRSVLEQFRPPASHSIPF